jgi:Zn-dependent M32 family carboxypeptidase
MKQPPAGRNERGEQMATLEGIRHGLLVSDRLGDLIDEVACRSGGDKDLPREPVAQVTGSFWLSIKHVSTVAFRKSASICA